MCTTWPVRLQRSDEKSDRNDHDHSDDGSDVEHVVAFLLGGDPVPLTFSAFVIAVLLTERDGVSTVDAV